MAKLYRIRAVSGPLSMNGGGRFCRGGRCFGAQPTELAEGDLTAEQLAAIQAEPMLVVEIVDAPKPEKPKGSGEEGKKPEDAKPGDQAPAGGQEQQAGDGQATLAEGSKEAAKPRQTAKAADKPAAKPGTQEGGK